jgi:hypothetical protein
MPPDGDGNSAARAWAVLSDRQTCQCGNVAVWELFQLFVVFLRIKRIWEHKYKREQAHTHTHARTIWGLKMTRVLKSMRFGSLPVVDDEGSF